MSQQSSNQGIVASGGAINAGAIAVGENAHAEQTSYATPSASSEEHGLSISHVLTHPIRILFLAANPKDTPRLRIDEEIRAIDQALRQAEFREKFEMEQQWAVRVTDLQGLLLRYKPDIVHFSGHGSASSELVLEDQNGNSRPISVRVLSTLFSTLKDNIKCVVLNACYSHGQAQAIAEHIGCVVGMPNEIADQVAIGFAAAFYQALGYGRDIKTAFDLGCIQIDLEGLDERSHPQLLALKSNPRDLVLVSSAQ